MYIGKRCVDQTESLDWVTGETLKVIIVMLVTDDKFKEIFQGHVSYGSFIRNVSKDVRNATARQLAVAVTETELASADVHSATIINEKGRKRMAKWSGASRHIRVLFAHQGTFVYKPDDKMQSTTRVRGDSDFDVIEKLRGQNQIALIAWSAEEDNDEPFVETNPSNLLKNEIAASALLKEEIASLKAEILSVKADARSAKVDLATAHRHIARLMQPAPVVPANANLPSTANSVKSFTVYTKVIGGFTRSFSDDFRPDTAPANDWEAQFLHGYLNANSHLPDCIFPNIIRIESRTQRYGENCDYGVIFEHPVTKGEVPCLQMKKAFRNFNKQYREMAGIYETFVLEGCV